MANVKTREHPRIHIARMRLGLLQQELNDVERRGDDELARSVGIELAEAAQRLKLLEAS